MASRVVRSAYLYDVDSVSVETALACEDVSLTQQSQADETDINVIVRRFGITGAMPQGLEPPTFEIFEDVFDYQSAQNALVAARESFMAMPADVRGRFDNDPQEFMVFCADKANLPEMRRLGLAVPEKEAPAKPEPLEVRVIPDPKP